MYKPNYTVVTCVMVVFVIMAFARLAFIGLIPPGKTNKLNKSHQKFLHSAGHQEIAWHQVEEEDVWEHARGSSKPILVVIGIPSSKLGHDFDLIAFEDPETAKFVSQNFFCIRIDGYEHPEWLNAILPLSRYRLGIVSGIQVWTLDSQGHVLNFIGRTYTGVPMDNNGVFKALLAARDQYEQIQAHPSKRGPIQDMQSGDYQLLNEFPGLNLPSLSAYTELLKSHCDNRYGGFPNGSMQELFPNAWRYLSLTGNHKLWQASLGPLLLSKIVDVQDGGFFRMALSRDTSRVEFDKGTQQNAEMMFALALEAQLTNDAFVRYLAESTFDWLAKAAAPTGLLPSCQEDDANPQGRSPRLSFPTWRLWQLFDASDRSWLNEELGLNPFNNAQMVPYFVSRKSLLDFRATFDRVIGQMRSSIPEHREMNDSGYLDVNGHALARMLEVARMWDDESRLESVKLMIKKLQDFQDQNDLMHLVDDEARRHGYLGDFLGLADVRVQQYIASGDPTVLQEGLHTLNLARRLFAGSEPGQFNMTREFDETGGFATMCVPEIVDELAESCSAQMIRLDLAYGRLTANTTEGQALIHEAQLGAAAFCNFAGRNGPWSAGYFCSVADVVDDRYAITVGPEARSLADDLYRTVPTRFIVAAAGPFRRDLQAKKPGIYVIGKTVKGPYTAEEAALLLPVSLSAPVSP